MKLLHHYKVEERANWKAIIDAQNELYHLPYLHRRTLGHVFGKNASSKSRFTDFSLYGHHNSWSGENAPSQKLTPFKLALIETGKNAPKFDVKHKLGDINHFNLFPNTVLTLYQIGNFTSCIMYNFWPVAVDRTIWEIRYYFREAASVRERLQQEYFKCLIREALQEDSATHENVHAGIATGAKSHIFVQDDEAPIRHFHSVLEHHLGLRCNSGNPAS